MASIQGQRDTPKGAEFNATEQALISALVAAIVRELSAAATTSQAA